MAQFFSYTFLPSDIAPAVRRRDLKMSLTAKEPNSPGLARNSPYSSSGSVAGGCCAAVPAAAQIPNATKVAEIRCRVRLDDRDKKERHVATCLLPTMCSPPSRFVRSAHPNCRCCRPLLMGPLDFGK